jgi:TRAP transporter TAXI family solute receptor
LIFISTIFADKIVHDKNVCNIEITLPEILKKLNLDSYIHTANDSMENLQLLKNSRVKFAIIDGKTLYEAYQGEGIFKNRPVKIRSIAALYPKKAFLIVKKGSKIDSNIDLKKQSEKIALLNKDTKYLLSPIIKTMYDKKISDVVDINDSIKRFNNGSIEALFIVDDELSKKVKTILSKTDTKLVPIYGKEINQIIRATDYYSKESISKKLYKNLQNDLETVGIKMVVATMTYRDKKDIDLVTLKIIKNINLFKDSNIIFRDLSKKRLIEELGAPQHKEAIKIFNSIE